MSIQKYAPYIANGLPKMTSEPDGDYVLYSDHLQEIADKEAEIAVEVEKGEWPKQQYQKIQDFVIKNRLWRGHPDTKSHADIVIELAQAALEQEG